MSWALGIAFSALEQIDTKVARRFKLQLQLHDRERFCNVLLLVDSDREQVCENERFGVTRKSLMFLRLWAQLPTLY